VRTPAWRTVKRACVLLVAVTFCATASGAPQSHAVLQLWPGIAPGSENARQVEKISTAPFSMVRNVVAPTLTVYRPEAAHATGAGVIIAPGGAFRFLSIDSEGHDVARWLVERGIAAFVLKYRVIATPENDAEMWTELRQVLGSGVRDFDEDAKLGIADGLQALKLVRERAHEWGLFSNRIGFMGFSAGAMITSHVALRAPEGERPAFAAPIYGAPFGEMPSVPGNTPPMFLAYASDDTLVGASVQSFYKVLTDAGQHPELHVYRSGGHGFGMRKQGKSSDYWIEDFYHWLESFGLTSLKTK